MTIKNVNGRAVGPRLQAHMDALVVGTPVDVRLDRECEFRCPNCSIDCHGWIEQGDTGVIDIIIPKGSAIIRCDEPVGCGQEMEILLLASHIYGVTIERLQDRESLSGSWFCAEELTIRNAKGGEDDG